MFVGSHYYDYLKGACLEETVSVGVCTQLFFDVIRIGLSLSAVRRIVRDISVHHFRVQKLNDI